MPLSTGARARPASDSNLCDRTCTGAVSSHSLWPMLADVIVPLAPLVPDLLAQDGVFLCSGIIDTRAHEVESALQKAGLTLTGRREKNGWVALEATR